MTRCRKCGAELRTSRRRRARAKLRDALDRIDALRRSSKPDERSYAFLFGMLYGHTNIALAILDGYCSTACGGTEYRFENIDAELAERES